MLHPTSLTNDSIIRNNDSFYQILLFYLGNYVEGWQFVGVAMAFCITRYRIDGYNFVSSGKVKVRT